MLEVLVAPYPGPGAQEYTSSTSSSGDAGKFFSLTQYPKSKSLIQRCLPARVGGDDRIWQAVPGLLPQWARFLRPITPPDWPHVYGVAKRAREEDEKGAIDDTKARPQKRTRLSRRRSAKKETKLHAEPEQKAKIILPTLIGEELIKPLNSQKQQADPRPRLASAKAELEEAVQANAEQGEALRPTTPHEERSLDLEEFAESATATAQIQHHVTAGSAEDCRQDHAPLPATSPLSTEEGTPTSCSAISLSPSLPSCPSPSGSPAPLRFPSSSRPQDQGTNHSAIPPHHHHQAEPVTEQKRPRFHALAGLHPQRRRTL